MSTSKPTSRDTPNADFASLSFEQAMEQLESIVEKLEAGEVGLEQTLSEYERGRALFVRCRDVLERAEQRVEELNRSPTKAPEPHTGL